MNDSMEDLTDQDFKALIRVLDDDDPDVSEHVWGRIMALGASAKERLEAEIDQLRLAIRSRDDCIADLQSVS